MSKSKGNVVTPLGLLEQYGSDGVRYWAASARPGTDTAFDESQMKVGRRLAIKLLNASRFALSFGSVDPGASVTEALDRAMLAELAALVEDATAAMDGFDHARALERTEMFFWRFCDDYLELVKGRAYGTEGTDEQSAATMSARAALTAALAVLHRLFAPVLVYTCEEVWSWWMEGSVHLADWPDATALRSAAADGNPVALDVAGAVLSEIRGAKSAAKASMRTPVVRAVVTDSAERIAVLRSVAADVAEAGKVADLQLTDGDSFSVEVTLADPDA